MPEEVPLLMLDLMSEFLRPIAFEKLAPEGTLEFVFGKLENGLYFRKKSKIL